ncbi:MAG: lipoxygenase family protein [Planctomycetota bacterium]|nr:lipoxygenase family protein [Planctomycetota bacterium]
MEPSLHQNSSSPEKRLAAIAKNRSLYQYDFSYHDIGFVKDVPHKDQIGLRYMAQYGEVMMTLMANKTASKLASWNPLKIAEKHSHYRERLKESSANANEIHGLFTDMVSDLKDGLPEDSSSFDDYKNVFGLITPPPYTENWSEDWAFAWQRLAGTNPVVLEGVGETLPENFPVTEAHYKEAIGPDVDDTLAAALSEGRLFICDYKLLDGIEAGDVKGRKHYLCAPMALFTVLKAHGDHGSQFMPVAIQCGQTPNSETPIFTPKSGMAWQMAKATVQSVDSNHHGVVQHLGYCHIVSCWVQLATWRSLAPNHPINVLLSPHFEYTLPNNQSTKKLILPGGVTPTLQSVSLEGAIELFKRGFEAFSWEEQSPDKGFARRGVDNTETLPVYPFRDDAMRTYAAIRKFVTAYVHLYYGIDADVLADNEVQAWHKELTAENAGRIRGMKPLDSVASLVDLVTSIIQRVTTYHASINYSGFEGMGFAPNMPAAAYAPAPVAGKEYTEADLLALLPPMDMAMEQLSMTYLLHSIRVTKLGDYPFLHFADHRVLPLVKSFKSDLVKAKKAIQSANQKRPIPYTILLPENIANSIQV